MGTGGEVRASRRARPPCKRRTHVQVGLGLFDNVSPQGKVGDNLLTFSLEDEGGGSGERGNEGRKRRGGLHGGRATGTPPGRGAAHLAKMVDKVVRQRVVRPSASLSAAWGAAWVVVSRRRGRANTVVTMRLGEPPPAALRPALTRNDMREGEQTVSWQ